MASSPFDDLKQIISQLPEGDICTAKKTIEQNEYKGLCSTDELVLLKNWLATWQGQEAPQMTEAHICVLGSSYAGHDQKSVHSFVQAAAKGEAPVNRLCVDQGIGLRVLELAPDMPHDVAAGWSEAECMAAVAFGMEATAAGGHVLGLSDLAPGNVMYALAILFTAGKGCFIRNFDDMKEYAAGDQNDILLAVEAAQNLVSTKSAEQNDEPLSCLLKFGGREIAASVGALVAARSRRLPVLVDGWAGLAAIAILEAEQAGSTDHVKVASCNSHLACDIAKSYGKQPLVGPAIMTGPGCGVAISAGLLKAACDI